MEKKKIELKRVNMNLPAELVNRVVQFGESMGLNTTSAYIVLLNQALDQRKSIDSMPMLIDAFNKMKNSGLLELMNDINDDDEEDEEDMTYLDE